MTRVKVITDKHTTKGVFEEKLARCQRRGAVNDEVDEALSSNRDGKEEASNDRFKLSRRARVIDITRVLKVITNKDVVEEVNRHKTKRYKYHKG
jgi:hypothetical protein